MSHWKSQLFLIHNKTHFYSNQKDSMPLGWVKIPSTLINTIRTSYDILLKHLNPFEMLLSVHTNCTRYSNQLNPPQRLCNEFPESETPCNRGARLKHLAKHMGHHVAFYMTTSTSNHIVVSLSHILKLIVITVSPAYFVKTLIR